MRCATAASLSDAGSTTSTPDLNCFRRTGSDNCSNSMHARYRSSGDIISAATDRCQCTRNTCTHAPVPRARLNMQYKSVSNMTLRARAAMSTLLSPTRTDPLCIFSARFYSAPREIKYTHLTANVTPCAHRQPVGELSRQFIVILRSRAAHNEQITCTHEDACSAPRTTRV
jgi:hypothetical protein